MSVPNLALLLRGEPAVWCADLALRNNGLGHVPGSRRVWVVSDPVAVEQVLTDRTGTFDKGGPFYGVIARALGADGLFTTNDPALWSRLHAVMWPSLQRQALQASGVSGVAGRLLRTRMAGWDVSRPVKLFEEFKQHSIELLAVYMFGAQVDSKRLARLTTRVFAGMAGRLFLPPRLPGGAAYAAAIRQLQEEIDRIIDERRRLPSAGTLLDALLGAQPALTRPQIREQAITMLMAGHDSTATVLAWVFVLLAEREGLYAQLRGSALAGDDTALVREVLQAAIHVRPAFPMFPRNVACPAHLAGQTIPAGAQLMVSPLAMHHDPRIWRGFDHFRHAWRHGLTSAQRAAHHPFGHGRRKCPGEAFALQVATIVMTEMLREFRYVERATPHSGWRSHYHMTSPPLDGGRVWLVR